MSDDLYLSIRPDVDFRPTFFIVDLKITNPKMMGKKAEFKLDLASDVHDSRAVDDAKNLYAHNFTVDRTEYQLKIPTDSFDCFTYKGTHASIVLRANLKVDDAWILKDSEVSRTAQLKLVDARTGGGGDASAEIDPFDKVQFSKNFNALSSDRKLAFLLLSLFCVIAGVWGPIAIWKMRDSDDPGGAIVGIIVLIVVVCVLWVWFKNKQFKSYMKVALQPMPAITRDTRLQIPQLISGKSEVDLKNMTLRVVACNMEKGQYVRGSGTNRRTVSFEEPVRPIILYSEKVSLIPSGQELGGHFPGEVDFGPIFKTLYPPLKISETHGLAVYWEVQLLHDEFIDHELKGPTDRVEVTDFFIA
ncbi:hypothetical protein OAL58_01985 [Verrucomicrobia bacterium]|nr:hypothetical protein [Verrucomicrobiota bacterium]